MTSSGGQPRAALRVLRDDDRRYLLCRLSLVEGNDDDPAGPIPPRREHEGNLLAQEVISLRIVPVMHVVDEVGRHPHEVRRRVVAQVNAEAGERDDTVALSGIVEGGGG